MVWTKIIMKVSQKLGEGLFFLLNYEGVFLFSLSR